LPNPVFNAAATLVGSMVLPHLAFDQSREESLDHKRAVALDANQRNTTP